LPRDSSPAPRTGTPPLTPNPSPPRGEGSLLAPLSPWGRGVGGEGGPPHFLSHRLFPSLFSRRGFVQRKRSPCFPVRAAFFRTFDTGAWRPCRLQCPIG